jgi:hypothetical protein
MRTSTTKRSTQYAAALAKGGKAHMFKPQAAGSDRAGNTGKDQSAASGARSAKGGKHPTKFVPSQPAKSGRTSAR